jgi:hypothetical protein
MDLLIDLITDVQSDLNVSSNSTLFPEATIKKAINRAYFKAGALFNWPALQDAQTTSSVTAQEYYEAPDTWRPNSIYRLEVSGVLYGEDPDGSPLDFTDYLTWKIDNPNSVDTKWAVQWLRYFIWPVPTANGSNDITIYGYKNVTELTLAADTTIFSYNMPDCNDALVMEASAILKRKGENDKSSQFVSAEAKNILALAYNRIKKDSARIEKNQPFFYVPDYFSQKGQGWDYDQDDF